MIVGSLFSGIGGLDLGLERAGMRIVWQCESDAFCRRVLAKHWPGVPCYHDVRDVDERAPRVDLICGGFPCQPFSEAGKQRGDRDDRYLWPEMLRVVAALKPRWFVGENVPGFAASVYAARVHADLVGLGYEVLAVEIPALAFGAPHIRYRCFVVANANSEGQPCATWQESKERDGSGNGGAALEYATSDGLESPRRIEQQEIGDQARHVHQWLVEPDVGRVAHGVPARVDRLRALGNAVVPQVAEWIGRRIMEAAGAVDTREGG